jgi:hypothetical protein
MLVSQNGTAAALQQAEWRLRIESALKGVTVELR